MDSSKCASESELRMEETFFVDVCPLSKLMCVPVPMSFSVSMRVERVAVVRIRRREETTNCFLQQEREMPFIV